MLHAHSRLSDTRRVSLHHDESIQERIEALPLEAQIELVVAVNKEIAKKLPYYERKYKCSGRM